MEKLYSQLERAEFALSGAKWLKMRIKPENYYVAFYKSGKFLITGVKSEKEINFLVNTWNQRLLTDKHKFRLHNGILDILRYLNENSYEMGIVSSTSKTATSSLF